MYPVPRASATVRSMYSFTFGKATKYWDKIGGSLLDRDAEALGQPVGLHPVGEPVGDHLRLRAHREGHLCRLDAVDPRRRRVVDVEPGTERLDQAGVVCQVRDDPQLDLVVVRDEQLAAGARHEGLAETAPE